MYLAYVYDGSFEGLLTCIYEAYYSSTRPEEIVSCDELIHNLLYQYITIETDAEKADKVLSAIKNKISSDALNYIFYVFLSSIPGSDTLIYKYIQLGFKLGRDVNAHLQNDIVLNMQKISKKVIFEKHNMLGFIRFKSISNNLYYAAIEPDHNILALVAPHFAARLPDTNWIIHDLKRELAAMYNSREWIISNLSKEKYNQVTLFEDCIYEDLWKEYFENLSIKERTNPRLQKRMMPARYWKHLTEMK